MVFNVSDLAQKRALAFSAKVNLYSIAWHVSKKNCTLEYFGRERVPKISFLKDRKYSYLVDFNKYA